MTAGRETTAKAAAERVWRRHNSEAKCSGCDYCVVAHAYLALAGRQTTPHTPSCHWYEQAEDGAESCDCGAAGRQTTLHCACGEHEVLNTNGLLFPGDGTAHAVRECVPATEARLPSPARATTTDEQRP